MKPVASSDEAVPRAGLHRMCLLQVTACLPLRNSPRFFSAQEGACFASSFTKVEEEFTAAVASTPCKADLRAQLTAT